MNQIRFDFLNGVNGGSGRTQNANSAQSGDAFAQILDRQLTRRADAGDGRRGVDARSRSDAAERTESPRPQAVKRREAKSAPVAATREDKPAAKSEPQARQPERTTAESEACTKPAAQPEDSTPLAATSAQTASEGDTPADAVEAEANPESADDTSRQQHEGETSQQPTDDGADPAETATAGADLSLLALLAIPLPLQTVAAEIDASAQAAVAGGGDDAAATALQAELAARLAGSIDFTAAVGGQAQAPANAGGLKFGAVLNAATGGPLQAGADTVAALQRAAEGLAKAADPLTQPKPAATESKPRDAAAGKAQEAGESKAATVNPELTAKAAAIVQPMNRAPAVTWSGINMRNELAESMALQAGAGFGTDDGEFSNWSQVLGAGASGLGSNAAARNSAFLSQLRQNLQNLPAHEQIAVQIKNAMQNGNSRVTVALHPVELGRVEVKLNIDKDKNVSATIVVDRPATLDLLRNDAKALERALQDAGLQTGSGSLSFNLRDSNGQGGDARNGTATGSGSGQDAGAGGSEVKAEVRADVVATADGYVDLET